MNNLSKVTLSVLKAPPGFGKTTLATAWADSALARGNKVGWLSLDESDDNAQRLMLYIASALQRAAEGASFSAATRIQELTLLPASQMATLLLNELEQSDAQWLLFIDDYHHVPPTVLIEALGPLVRYAPDNFHLVLCGRTDLAPELYLHLYSDAIFEVDTARLKFTLDETWQLVANNQGENTDQSQVLEMYQHSDGWIAALRARLFVQHSTHSPQQHYLGLSGLFDEVLRRLPEPIAQYLPALAVVNKFTARLAEVVSGCPDGRALIRQLEHLQIFLASLDASGQWYALHPLFRDHLRKTLARTEGLEKNAMIRAAQWFAEQHLWADAVQTSLNADDDASALQWISRCAMSLVEHGDFIQLLDWGRRLKSRLLQAPPPLKLALAWASALAMQGDKSLSLLDEVTEQLDDASSELYWECEALRAMLLALKDNSLQSGVLTARCLPHLDRVPWIRNAMLNTLCYSHIQQCRWEAFYSVPPPFDSPHEHHRYIFTQTYRQCMMGQAEYRQGHIERAVSILEGAIAQAGPATQGPGGYAHPVLRALPAAFLSAIHYQTGQFEAARRLNLESLDMVRYAGFLDCAAAAFITANHLARCQGQPNVARRILAEAENLASERGWLRLSVLTLIERLRLSLAEHNTQEARACFNELLGLLDTPPAAGLEYLGLRSLASLWYEVKGRSANADLEKANADCTQAQQLGLIPLSLQLLAAIAIVTFTRGHVEQAADTLLRLTDPLASTGLLRLVADQPGSAQLRPLIDQVLDSRQTTSAQQQILQALGQVLSSPEKVSELNASSVTSKERQVLELVAAGKSNKEIARLLNITPETVKTHMKNIFIKLGVDSRAQAAVKAKSNGLIEGLKG
ncbi:LuxR C-terminal-related transcriptional regulator [Pseudomonas farris]